jgi:hypothetical protein
LILESEISAPELASLLRSLPQTRRIRHDVKRASRIPGIRPLLDRVRYAALEYIEATNALAQAIDEAILVG